MTTDAEEAGLIARMQNGDLEAFDGIVRRFLQRAYLIAYRLLGDHHDAEDLVQEAFMTALQNIQRFDRRRPFGPWFYRILVNRGVNQRRARRVRQMEPLDPGKFATEAAGPAVDAERASLRAAIAEAMATLSERERLIIQLHEVDGFSGEEIAAMLEIPAGTVRWHLHQARRRLRAKLAVNQECR